MAPGRIGVWMEINTEFKPPQAGSWDARLPVQVLLMVVCSNTFNILGCLGLSGLESGDMGLAISPALPNSTSGS